MVRAGPLERANTITLAVIDLTHAISANPVVARCYSSKCANTGVPYGGKVYVPKMFERKSCILDVKNWQLDVNKFHITCHSRCRDIA